MRPVMSPPPRVKICGVTRVADALAAMDLGADYLGLNFWPASPRCVDLAAARRIATAVRGRARVVGVFVDAGLDRVREVDAAVGLDLVQLHGAESAEEVAALGERALRALKVAGPLSDAVLAPYPRAWGFLFDCPGGDAPGGTGISWSYRAMAALEDPRPRFVAGGVHPGNARRALAESGATGVDVCSGVESSPGVKDAERMAALFAALGRGAARRTSGGQAGDGR